MKKIVLFSALLLLCVGSVKGQCTGYSATITPAALAPGDVAARGGVTVTLTAQATSDEYGNNPLPGAVPSHNGVGMLSTTPMGWRIVWSSNNAVTVHAYLKVGDNPEMDYGFYPLNGVGHFGMGSGDINKPYKMRLVATDQYGNTTQDHITVNTVYGNGPALVSQDELPTNAYTQVTINFGGGSMLNNCQQCQGGSTQHCLQATHTPYVTMTAVNHTSGESQSLPRQQAGNIANAQSSVSGTGSIWISVLPGDTVDGTANAEIFCSMFGDLPVSGNDEWGLDWELAWTKFSTIQSSCLPAGGNPPSIGCKVTSKYMCNTNSQPADLQVNQVFAEYDTNGNPVTLETVPPFWWGWGFGIRGKVAGFTTPWIFPANILQQYKVGDMSGFAHVVLEIAAGAFPSNSTIRNCTNKDLGKGPEVFPPLDQP